MSAEPRQTRSALQDQGEIMSAGVTLGQVIAVELTFESEVGMLGSTSEYMSTLKPGDDVVEVRKMEPAQSAPVDSR